MSKSNNSKKIFAILLFVLCSLCLNAQETGTDDLSIEGILEQAKTLQAEDKEEEALALLENGILVYPASFDIIAAKYRIHYSQKKYDKCLDLIEDKESIIPAESRKDVRNAKCKILHKLMGEELERGQYENAFSYLKRLADSGYRGFHDLKYDEECKVLHGMPGYKDLLKKIEDNTGLGKPAKDFNAILSNGDEFILSHQRGKVVLIDFWSTYCGPCIEEIPNLRMLYEKYHKSGLEIISISLDSKKERLDKFMSEHSMPWKHVYSGKGWNDDTAQLYEVAWVPSLWFVDRNGILRFFDQRGDDLMASVKLLMNESKQPQKN